jgi:subtilisin family serine protease
MLKDLERENLREGPNGIQHQLKYDYTIGEFKGFSGQFSSRYVASLKSNPDVLFVEADGIVKAIGTQKDAPWGLSRISHRDNTADKTYTYPDKAGEGSTVYVIDTGILIEHPDFNGRASFAEKAFCDGCPTKDDNGHGTHCAGTIAGTTYGVAKKAKVVAVKVLDADGSGTYAGVIAGIDYVAGKTKSVTQIVASMSLGGPKNDAVNLAVKKAIDAGVSFSIAAGNENSDACNVSPASVAEAVTVGASDSKDKAASFTNYGSCVDVFAPGVDIISTWNNGKTNTISGTSMAAPHVAGAMALFLSMDPSLSPSAMAAKIKSSATKDKLTGLKPKTENLLLFVGSSGSPPSTTTQVITTTRISTITSTIPITTTKTVTKTQTRLAPTTTTTRNCPWWFPTKLPCPLESEEDAE